MGALVRILLASQLRCRHAGQSAIGSWGRLNQVLPDHADIRILFLPFMVVLKSWKSPKAVKMNTLGSCSRDDEDALDEDALHDRAFCVRARSPSGRPGLHALPRSAARQPIAGPGSGARSRTAVPPAPPPPRAQYPPPRQT